MTIGENVKNQIIAQVERLVAEHLDDLDMAYSQENEEGEEKLGLTASVSVKLSPNEKNGLYVDVETTLSFTKEKVKDRIKGCASEVQMSILPAMEGKG